MTSISKTLVVAVIAVGLAGIVLLLFRPEPPLPAVSRQELPLPGSTKAVGATSQLIFTIPLPIPGKFEPLKTFEPILYDGIYPELEVERVRGQYRDRIPGLEDFQE